MLKKNVDFKSILADMTTTKSILSKMVAMFLLLIIIPLSTIGFISTKTASENLLKSTEDSVKGATYQASNNFDSFLDKALNVSLQIIANKNIQDFSNLGENVNDSDKLTIKRNASDAVSNINSTTMDMDSKVLYNTGDVLGDMTPPDDMAKVMMTGWYKKVLEADGSPCWTDYSEATKNKVQRPAISLVRLYKTTATADASGLVIVDINYKPISTILKSIELGKKDTSYLLTPDGKVLSGNGVSEEASLAKRQFVKEVHNHLARKGDGLFNTVDNGVNYLVSYYKSAKTGMTVVTIIPNSAITAGAAQIMRTTIFFGIIFILLAGVIGFIFSLGITLAMKSIMDVMSKAEKGDLTVSLKMKRKDEIGKLAESFNMMIVKIRELVIQNKQAAEEVVASSTKMAAISTGSSRISSEIAHAIVEVAAGSSNQASEIEASVKNVSQLADRISVAVRKTEVMETDSESMKELSDIGIATVDNLNLKSIQTNEITANVVKEIAQLNQYVKNINIITQVLRSIADQTNLLALNAAIEAARAGDAGKGFAVVADEIRKLAEQSNNNTREIQKHIENIFKQTQSTTNLVIKAETSIKEQSEMVTQTAEAFSRINTTTTSLGENISKVGSMIEDMDSYKEMVISSMENISAVSEQVSASTQEVSASTEEQLASVGQLDDMAKNLNELAENLLSKMENFKV
jgi:methyl-accepting chemotaxis protein